MGLPASICLGVFWSFAIPWETPKKTGISWKSSLHYSGLQSDSCAVCELYLSYKPEGCCWERGLSVIYLQPNTETTPFPALLYYFPQCLPQLKRGREKWKQMCCFLYTVSNEHLECQVNGFSQMHLLSMRKNCSNSEEGGGGGRGAQALVF